MSTGLDIFAPTIQKTNFWLPGLHVGTGLGGPAQSRTKGYASLYKHGVTASL